MLLEGSAGGGGRELAAGHENGDFDLAVGGGQAGAGAGEVHAAKFAHQMQTAAFELRVAAGGDIDHAVSIDAAELDHDQGADGAQGHLGGRAGF